MRTVTTVPLIVFALWLFLVSGAPPASATVYIVDAAGGGNFTTIQDALDVTVEDDVIQVVAGTYSGDGNRDLYFGFDDNGVTLESISGPDVTIIDNQGASGHRLFAISGSEFDTTTVVRGFTIQGGRYDGNGNGAGIYIGSEADPIIENCIIRDNHTTGGLGGGVYVYSHCEPIFRDCTFDANSSNGAGAGLHCSTYSPATIRDCVFTNNESQSGLGGALGCSGVSGATIHNTWFEGNTAGQHGGAIGIYNSMPFVFNSVFLDNEAGENGGAVYGQEAEGQFHNCTFVKNRALGEGSVYYVWAASDPFFSRCIFAFSQESRGSTFYCDGSSVPVVTQSCCFANPEGTEPCGTTSSILYADPLFCDITANDLTLASDSPCLPATNPWGQHLGALDEGCVESPVEAITWGTIKAMYR